jgi:hypothetical protein
VIKIMGAAINRRAQAYLAACYAQMNSMNEAKAEMEKFLGHSQGDGRESGDDSIAATLENVSEWADRYRVPSDREHFLEGLSKAGLPE